MTGYLYRLTLDIAVQAESKRDADEIAKTLMDTEDARIYDDGIEMWSSGVQYMGIDTEGDNENCGGGMNK